MFRASFAVEEFEDRFERRCPLDLFPLGDGRRSQSVLASVAQAAEETIPVSPGRPLQGRDRAKQLRRRLIENGVTVSPSSPEAFANLITSETTRWGKIIRDKGIKPES